MNVVRVNKFRQIHLWRRQIIHYVRSGASRLILALFTARHEHCDTGLICPRRERRRDPEVRVPLPQRRLRGHRQEPVGDVIEALVQVIDALRRQLDPGLREEFAVRGDKPRGGGEPLCER
jgi:hypothetical protein